MTYLDKMVPGQKGIVVGFADDSKISRRLLELGLIPGRKVIYVRNAPLSDPMEVLVGSNRISLRHAEASLVTVKLEK